MHTHSAAIGTLTLALVLSAIALFQPTAARAQDAGGAASNLSCEFLATEIRLSALAWFSSREVSAEERAWAEEQAARRARGEACLLPGEADAGHGSDAGSAARRGDYARARVLYSDACDRGEALSCFELGNMQRQGTGGPKDMAGARVSFARGCRTDGPSCRAAGILFEYGWGGSHDLAQAWEFYREGCDLDDAVACHNAGVLSEKGKGTPQNLPEARRYYRLGCDGGNDTSCYNLGIFLDDGVGGSADRPAALDAFLKGCELGYEPSCREAEKLQ
ncbi:MAG: sel1 repeat family protein [Erythrobacter sp.]|nr:sel1 repeat family protein [Erythrobacter sp.]NCQ64271.1 sel1 repeat family protein [Alphaproteobacteria bacterium]